MSNANEWQFHWSALREHFSADLEKLSYKEMLSELEIRDMPPENLEVIFDDKLHYILLQINAYFYARQTKESVVASETIDIYDSFHISAAATRFDRIKEIFNIFGCWFKVNYDIVTYYKKSGTRTISTVLKTYNVCPHLSKDHGKHFMFLAGR